MPVEVQQAVYDVTCSLAVNCFAVFARLPPGGVCAEDDLAVAERNHVRCARNIHKLPVNPRDNAVRHEDDIHFFQVSEQRFAWSGMIQAS